MKSGGIRLALWAAILLCLSPSIGLALELYYNNVDAGLPGSGITPVGMWAWTSGPDAVFTDEVTETGGVGGTQSFRQTTDATAAFGTSWYFARGFGQLAVWADASNPLAGGAPGSNNPARYRFSMDVYVSGNNGGDGAAPIWLGISGSDNTYEGTHGIDVNNDGDLLDGADLYNHQFAPALAVSDQWTTISWTFNQGLPQALDPDIPAQDQGFSNALTLQWYAFYNSGAFGLDADNVVNMDNFRIEFLAGQNGDFNDNGKVDGADYVVWRKNLGTTNSLPNDDGIGGTVGPAQYNLWRSNFGNPGSGSGLSASVVPEPAAFTLAVVAAIASCSLGAPVRRRARH